VGKVMDVARQISDWIHESRARKGVSLVSDSLRRPMWLRLTWLRTGTGTGTAQQSRTTSSTLSRR
jgi:hypothetical protein